MLTVTTDTSKEHGLITVGFRYHEEGASFEVQLTLVEAAALVNRLIEEVAKCKAKGERDV